MKKISAKKNTVNKKSPVVRAVAPAVEKKETKLKPCIHTWSVSIYIYWFIVLFFFGASFYILGRAHNTNSMKASVAVTEEALLQSAEYYNNAKQSLMDGNVDAALVDLAAAIDGGAASVDAYILRAEAYMQNGDYANALTDLDVALSKDPTSAVAYYDRYLLNLRLENYEAAMADINNAMAANTTSPSAILQMRDLYARRGQLNLWLKNWEGAVADYTNSLSRPEGTVDPGVYAERAEAYTALGEFRKAITDYSSAVRVISEQIQGATTLEERERLSSRAMSYFEKSAALNLSLSDIEATRLDLESAYTIAVALNDADSIARLQRLMNELTDVANVSADVPVAETDVPETPVSETSETVTE